MYHSWKPPKPPLSVFSHQKTVTTHWHIVSLYISAPLEPTLCVCSRPVLCLALFAVNRSRKEPKVGHNGHLNFPTMSTRMCKLKLLDLPVEILSEILIQLDHLYILRCSAVRLSNPPLTHPPLYYQIRSAGSSTPSSPPPSPSNTASSSPQTGSSTATQAAQHRPPQRAWRSCSSAAQPGAPCAPKRAPP